VDHGTEFINKPMKTWCSQQGIEIQMTAPYSPSQNGVAERMNRTLVELARAMITTRELPEFLWEAATAHAMYLRNRSFSSAVADATPYERWHGEKPDVSHIREFGSKVLILADGPNTPHKMLPKAIEKTLVGFDDRSRAIMYYNKDTRKILTSRNYRLVNSTGTLPPGDHTWDPLKHTREEIPGTSAQGNAQGPPTEADHTDQNSELNKRKADDDLDSDRKRTRGVKMDYK
jgi:transposase InsO family protein